MHWVSGRRSRIFLDQQEAQGSLAKAVPAELRRKITDFLAQQGVTLPASDEVRAISDTALYVIGALALVLLIVTQLWLPVLALLLVFVVTLRWHELRDNSGLRRTPIPAGGKITTLIQKEDIKVQNQLTHLVDIKPGRFRLLTLKLVFWAINLLAKIKFNQGSLGGIPTIHFARWVILDNKRLLFFSNYDGSWDNYLGDFVDKASIGLTAVWSNTANFPKTMLLAFEGARDIEPFKKWTRECQIPTQVWYSAYPEHTVRNIRDAVEIAENIKRPLGDAELAAWLTRL